MSLPPLERLSQLEALLFMSGEPLALERIKTLLSINEEELQIALDTLEKKLAEDASSGLMLIRHRDQVELATKKEHLHLVETFTKSFLQESLSKAALEVLAIVAYRAPISRSSIEAIRGVNCSFTIRNLLLRGLIEREENPEDAREYVYHPSFALLEKLGISSKEHLPDYAALAHDERVEALVEKESVLVSPTTQSEEV